MVLPPKNKEKIFEELLQDLPPEIKELAIEFKAFTRCRKIKTVFEAKVFFKNICLEKNY
jgi:hypothetical protein